MNHSSLENFQPELKLNSEQQPIVSTSPPAFGNTNVMRLPFSVRNNPLSELYNMDCVEGMKHYPDKYFDLAIVDPPYGIRIMKQWGEKKHDYRQFEVKEWDNEIPTIIYFTELFRVSKNQIIWGGNYFSHLLPSSQCWLMWDKCQREFTLADGELAWTSFDKAIRICSIHRSNKNNPDRIHICQKPEKLYNWILKKFAEPGQRILDTHVGSGSSRIACYNNGFDFVGFEIDKDYCEASEKRFINATMQQSFDFGG